eukprot:6463700-Amphidinium_carterae.3
MELFKSLVYQLLGVREMLCQWLPGSVDLLLCAQADVQRLQACIGKCGKSSMVMVAAAVESNSWLLSRLQEYMAKSPAMLSMGHAVAEGVATLQGLVVDSTAIPKVAHLLKSVPTLQQSLRANACDSLVVQLRDSIDALWQQHQSFSDVALLREFSELLMSAGILYPLDAAIQKYILDLGEKIRTTSEVEVLNGLMAKCNALTEVDINVPSLFKECLSALADTVQPLSVNASQLQESHQSSILVTLKTIHAFANQHNLTVAEIQVVVELSINVGTKLAALLGERGDDITFIKVAMDLTPL